MPLYSIKGPDGNTYQIEGPEGATREQIIDAVRYKLGAQAKPQAAPETTFGGNVKEFFKGLAPGAVGLVESAAVGASALLPKDTEESARKRIAEIAGAAKAPFAAAPGYEETVGRKFGEAAGSIIPFLGLGPAGVVGRAGMAALGTGAGAGEARTRAEQEGATADQRGTATALGSVVGISEMFAPLRILGRVADPIKAGAVAQLKRIAAAGGEEAAQEAAAQIAQNLIAKGVYKPEQAIIEQVGESAAYGGAVGAMAQGLMDLALGRRAKKVGTSDEIAQARAEADAARAAEAEMKASPEYAQQFVTDYETRRQQFVAQRAELKKPGKDATPDVWQTYEDQKKALTDLRETLKDDAKEYNRLKPQVQQAQAAADQQRAAELETATAGMGEAQTQPFFYEPQQTLPGFGGAVPQAQPEAAPQEFVDYSQQVRLLNDRLDELRTQAQQTTDLDAKIELGRLYGQTETALQEAQTLLAQQTPAAPPSPEAKIKRLRKEMAAAEEAGDLPKQVKLAERLKELGVADLAVQPAAPAAPAQAEIALEPFKTKVSTKAEYSAVDYKPGAPDIEAQEQAYLEEAERQRQEAMREAEREQKIAPEVLALRRIQAAERPALAEGVQRQGQISGLVEQLGETLRGGKVPVAGRVVSGGVGTDLSQIEELRAQLAFAKATDNRQREQELRKQMEDLRAPDDTRSVDDLDFGEVIKKTGVEGRLTSEAMAANRVTRMSQAQLGAYDKLASFVQSVRESDQVLAEANLDSLRNAAERMKDVVAGQALLEVNTRRAQAGLEPLAAAKQAEVVGRVNRVLNELVTRGAKMFAPQTAPTKTTRTARVDTPFDDKLNAARVAYDAAQKEYVPQINAASARVAQARQQAVAATNAQEALALEATLLYDPVVKQGQEAQRALNTKRREFAALINQRNDFLKKEARPQATQPGFFNNFTAASSSLRAQMRSIMDSVGGIKAPAAAAAAPKAPGKARIVMEGLRREPEGRERSIEKQFEAAFDRAKTDEDYRTLKELQRRMKNMSPELQAEVLEQVRRVATGRALDLSPQLQQSLETSRRAGVSDQGQEELFAGTSERGTFRTTPEKFQKYLSSAEVQKKIAALRNQQERTKKQADKAKAQSEALQAKIAQTDKILSNIEKAKPKTEIGKAAQNLKAALTRGQPAVEAADRVQDARRRALRDINETVEELKDAVKSSEQALEQLGKDYAFITQQLAIGPRYPSTREAVQRVDKQITATEKSVAEAKQALEDARTAQQKLLEKHATDTIENSIIRKGEAERQKIDKALKALQDAEQTASDARIKLLESRRAAPSAGAVDIVRVYRDTSDTKVQADVAKERKNIAKAEEAHAAATTAAEKAAAVKDIEASYDKVYELLNNAPLKQERMSDTSAAAQKKFDEAQAAELDKTLKLFEETAGIAPLKMTARRTIASVRNVQTGRVETQVKKESVAQQERRFKQEQETGEYAASTLEKLAKANADLQETQRQINYIDANRAEPRTPARKRQDEARANAVAKRKEIEAQIKELKAAQKETIAEARIERQAEKELRKETGRMLRREQEEEVGVVRGVTVEQPAPIGPVNETVLRQQVDTLSTEEVAKLETAYGVKKRSKTFIAKLSADIVDMVNNGGKAVARGIRNIVKKMSAGVLAAAMVFNPQFSATNFSFDLPKAYSQTLTETVSIKAAVPAAAREKMSPLAQMVYENMAPTAKASGKGFGIVDKVNGAIHFFNNDGSLLVQGPALMGKDAGDVLGKSSLEGGPKITPAGRFTLEVSKDAFYGTSFNLLETFDSTGYVAIHPVYLGNLKENRLGRLQSPEATDNRVSYGCINTTKEMFVDKLAPNADSLNGGMLFIMPDITERTAEMFPAKVETVTKTFSGTEQTAKAEGRSLVGREEKLPEVKTLYQVATEINDAPRVEVDPKKSAASLMADIAATSKTPLNRAVAERLKGLLGNTSVYVVKDLRNDQGGAVFGAAAVDGSHIALDADSGRNEQTILHEGVHAATERVLRTSEDALTKTQLNAKRELKALYEAYAADAAAPNDNAKESLSEFVSDALSDPAVQRYMQGKKWTLKNMWTAFKNSILRTIGVDTPSTMLEATLAAADALMLTVPRPTRATTERLFMRKPQYASPEMEKAVGKLDPFVTKQRGVNERVRAASGGFLGLETQLVDRFAGFERLRKYMPELQGTQMIYYMRMYDQRMNMVSQAVGTGAPVIAEKKREDGKIERVLEAKEGPSIKGVVETLKDASPMVGNSEAVNRLFTAYMAAIRADSKGFESLNFGEDVTRADLDSALSVVNNNPELKKIFDKARGEYNAYNRSLINFVVETGALSKKTATRLLAENDYIPFYRERNGVAELLIGNETPIRIGSIKSQPYLQELVGGDQPILDFMTSSVQNTNMLIDMGMRNLATKNAVFELLDLSAAKLVRKAEGTDVVQFKVDGEDRYAVLATEKVKIGNKEFDTGVPADILVKGMEGIPAQMPFIFRALAIPAQILRKGVTLSPMYMANQLFRDSLAAPIAAGANFTPVLGALRQIGKPAAETLERRGITGGQQFTGSSDDLTMILRGIADGKPGWMNALAKAEAISMSADSLTRRAQYNSYIEQGMSEMEATLLALESMNFNKRGASPSIHIANALIPFFNAQIQGLNVLYKAMTGQMPFNDKLKIRQKLLQRGGMMAAASVVYALMMQDDEAYKNAEADQKYGKWFVRIPGVDEPVRVPIPFELGYIFKALPEALVNSMLNEHGDEEAVKAFKQIVLQTIPGGSSYGIPQALKPAIEAGLGKSFYTGRDILSAREKDVLPEEQFRTNTAEMSKLIGQMTGTSPIIFENLVRGYTGTVGLAFLQALSLGVPPGESPEKAVKRLSEYPIVGGAFQPNDAGGITNSVYERMNDAQKVERTYNKLVEEGRMAEAKALLQRRSSEIMQAELAKEFKSNMNQLVAAERAVQASNLSPEEKRAQLDQIRKLKIAVAKEIRDVADKTTRLSFSL